MNQVLDFIRGIVRSWIRLVAQLINKATGGHLSANSVTLIGLLGHIPVALAIAGGQYRMAAVLLVIFGLFDILDGELARLQKREGPRGGLLDAVADRMKEVLLYSGIAYNFVATEVPYLTVWAVMALGGSILVSYVKAKGEAAVGASGLAWEQVNKLFQDGLLRFEVRMALLVVGLLVNRMALAVVIIAIGSWLTAMDRLLKISKKLK
jgi:phosphatidylglycerophosphate synthase